MCFDEMFEDVNWPHNHAREFYDNLCVICILLFEKRWNFHVWTVKENNKTVIVAVWQKIWHFCESRHKNDYLFIYLFQSNIKLISDLKFSPIAQFSPQLNKFSQ